VAEVPFADDLTSHAQKHGQARLSESVDGGKPHTVVVMITGFALNRISSTVSGGA
jgi:hypothetical protein